MATQNRKDYLREKKRESRARQKAQASTTVNTVNKKRSTSPEAAIATLPFRDGELVVTRGEAQALQLSYKRIDVEETLRQIYQWLKANRDKRKMLASAEDFITRWLKGDNDKAAERNIRIEAETRGRRKDSAQDKPTRTLLQNRREELTRWAVADIKARPDDLNAMTALLQIEQEGEPQPFTLAEQEKERVRKLAVEFHAGPLAMASKTNSQDAQ
jgi:hypothetical protein